MPAVLIAAVLLTVSPTLVYYSRFDRDELFVRLTLAIVICIWRYIDEQKERYILLTAAAMALRSPPWVTFILVAIFLVFLDLMLAVELGRQPRGEEISGLAAVRTAAIALIAWLLAAIWSTLPRRPFDEQTATCWRRAAPGGASGLAAVLGGHPGVALRHQLRL
jgi:predicted membrane-bound mannosyltransferase